MSDAKKAEWIQACRKSWSGFTGLTNRMVDSEAFQALKSVHSVKVLIWFWRMAQYPREKRRPGQDSPIGNLKKILNCKDLSFEYRIAGYRGMVPKQFVHALRELFKYGFIDIVHHGRGIKGDWTRFAYSDRWKDYGTERWKELPFPIADRVGWRAAKKSHYPKGKLSTSQKGSYRVVETGDDFLNGKLKTVGLPDFSTSQLGSPSRSTKPSTTSNRDGRIKKDVVREEEVGGACGRRKFAAPYSPRKAELEWNVRSVLGQLPDLSFDKWDISWFVSQLQAARKGDLDPEKVRQGMETRGLDEFTVDVLFTVAGIELPGADDIQIPVPEASAVPVEATH